MAIAEHIEQALSVIQIAEIAVTQALAAIEKAEVSLPWFPLPDGKASMCTQIRAAQIREAADTVCQRAREVVRSAGWLEQVAENMAVVALDEGRATHVLQALAASIPARVVAEAPCSSPP